MVHLEKTGVFPIGKIPEKKEESLRFLLFLARGLDQMRGAVRADIKVFLL